MKATILLISYNPGGCDSLGDALRLEGYDITVAANGPEVFNSLRATGFDLVLLDLDMPISNAWDTLGQIITISLSLPLIIVTGHPDQQRLATQKGVVAVLEKPLEMPLLLGVMQRALAQTSAVRGHDTNQASL
jgi:DNA-binding NtrC family response regulator